MYIDTHCHLTDDKLKDRTKEIVESAESAGVKLIIDVGCNTQSSVAACRNAEKFDGVFFAAGVHPSDCEEYEKEAENAIKTLLSHPKCVAVGEIGLDRHYKPFDEIKQRECFVSQLEIAAEYKLPVSFHVREAVAPACDIIRAFRGRLSGGVMHCFSGSKETAKELLDEGMYFSFGGTSTYKNATGVREVIAYLPQDRILTETDSPYLAPEGKRGTANEPANIPIIAENIAKIKGLSIEKFAETSLQNAFDLFFKLKPKKE